MEKKQKNGFGNYKKGVIISILPILFVFIGLLNSCASYPMNGRFASTDIPVAEQSVLTTEPSVLGAVLVSINGTPVGSQMRATENCFVIPPGNHEITVRYSQSVDTNAFSVYMLGRGVPDADGNITVEETVLESVNNFTFTFNFLPGRYYMIAALTPPLRYFTANQSASVPANTIAYGIVDFTTKNLEVVWSTNHNVNDGIRRALSAPNYNLTRGLIQRSINTNKGFW